MKKYLFASLLLLGSFAHGASMPVKITPYEVATSTNFTVASVTVTTFTPTMVGMRAVEIQHSLTNATTVYIGFDVTVSTSTGRALKGDETWFIPMMENVKLFFYSQGISVIHLSQFK